ncbi:hypothetical protein V8F20_011397 [Naviculisporaceae sp. PSN 640]
MVSISGFTTLLAAASLVAPGQCLWPPIRAEALSTSISSSSASISTLRRDGHVHSAPTFPQVPTVNNLATFTGSVPKPTQSISCDTSLGKIVRTNNGKGYLLNCNFQFPNNDLSSLHAADWATCMEACSVAAGCKAFEYHSDVTGQNCNLKTAGDPHTWELGDKIWIGWEVGITTMKTVHITPLPTPTPPLKFNPDPNSYDPACFNCGITSHRQNLIDAIGFFCANGYPGNQTFGQRYPDRLLQGGDTISLEYQYYDSRSINIIVSVKDGCVVDFASLDDGTCNALLITSLVDGCDWDQYHDIKRGGLLEDDCSKWTLDVQYTTKNVVWDNCTQNCHVWRNYFYDGDRTDDWICIQ